MAGFEEAIRGGSLILTDGGIETRVMFETEVELPAHVQVAALVDDPVGGPVLRQIYESYVAAARPFGLPVIIGTPTFRASLNFVRRADLGAPKRSGGSTQPPPRCTQISGIGPSPTPYTSPA